MAVLQQTAIDGVAPFVRRVTFKVLNKSWTLGPDLFRKILLSQAIQRHCRDNQTSDGDGSKLDEIDGLQKFVQEHFDGREPLEAELIDSAYEKYHNDARAQGTLLQDSDIDQVWAGVLGQLSNALAIRFDAEKLDDNGPDYLTEATQYHIMPHHHGVAHEESECRKQYAPDGDWLFIVGVAALVKAQTKVTKLTVRCMMTSKLVYTWLDKWDQLDFGSLQRFDFNPMVHLIGESLYDYGFSRDPNVLAMDASSAVLEKCRSSLETFRYGKYVTYFPNQWPPRKIIALPKLKMIEIGSGPIYAHDLAAWMRFMPVLEHFQLDGSSVDGPYENWKIIFDAIRNHPKPSGMQVVLGQIISKDSAEMSLRFNTKDVQEYLDMPDKEESDPWMDSFRSLPLYLSGHIGWNKSLKMFHEMDD